MVNLRPAYHHEGLPQIVERMLDKGVVIDLKLRLALEKIQLIKMRATIILSSFETTAKYGLPFPAIVNHDTAAWKNLLTKEKCPQCEKLVDAKEFISGCPWCSFSWSG